MRLTLFITLIITVILASTAFGWRSVHTGQKNFERGWSSFTFKNTDNARSHFEKAARAFAEGLAENPPSRTTLFASNLGQAGMAFYFSGRYQEAVDTMSKVDGRDRELWEAPLFTGLAYARLHNESEAVRFLKTYLDRAPGMAYLSESVSRQLAGLEAGSAALDDAAAAIEDGLLRQVIHNINTLGRNVPNPKERCDGNYWWRYNRKPCEDGRSVYR